MSTRRSARQSSARAASQSSVPVDTPSATPARRNTPETNLQDSTVEHLASIATTPSRAYGSDDVASMPAAVSITDTLNFAENLQGTIAGAQRGARAKRAGSRASNASSRVTRQSTPAKVSTVEEESEPDSQQQPAAASVTPGEMTTSFNKEASGFGHVPPPLERGAPVEPGVVMDRTAPPPTAPASVSTLRMWWAGCRAILPVLGPYLLLLVGMGLMYWGIPGTVQGLAGTVARVGGLAERLTVLEADVWSLQSERTVEYSTSTQEWRQGAIATPPERMVNFFATGLGGVVDPYYTSPTMYPPSTWKQDLANRVFFLGRPNPNPPVAALEGWDDIGDCWCSAHSKYGKAQLAVLMPRTIYPTQVTVEHIPATATLDIGAAPKEMELWAQIDDEDARGQITRSQDSDSDDYQEPVPGRALDPTFVRIASWQYDIHAASNVQTFPVSVDMKSFGAGVRRVLIRAKSNDGTSDYTCLYRVRMHGELAD
ncbi:MAG: hypothetical protein M1812_000715 [Candelaria pacifica]|nr:MAG: hypothetical protein M1812_000715 [Candelaria pacifica]